MVWNEKGKDEKRLIKECFCWINIWVACAMYYVVWSWESRVEKSYHYYFSVVELLLLPVVAASKSNRIVTLNSYHKSAFCLFCLLAAAAIASSHVVVYHLIHVVCNIIKLSSRSCGEHSCTFHCCKEFHILYNYNIHIALVSAVCTRLSDCEAWLYLTFNYRTLSTEWSTFVER